MNHYPAILSAAACALISSAAMGADAVVDAKPYRVVGGQVDNATFTGWRVYHETCYICHGLDAVGTSVAPSLVERMHDLSAKDFAIKVATSYRIVLGLDQAHGDDPSAIREAMAAEVERHADNALLMPAWEGNPQVKPRLSDLYAYLKARSDGALGPGKPRRLADC